MNDVVDMQEFFNLSSSFYSLFISLRGRIGRKAFSPYFKDKKIFHSSSWILLDSYNWTRALGWSRPIRPKARELARTGVLPSLAGEEGVTIQSVPPDQTGAQSNELNRGPLELVQHFR
jgi:hypothetical protein